MLHAWNPSEDGFGGECRGHSSDLVDSIEEGEIERNEFGLKRWVSKRGTKLKLPTKPSIGPPIVSPLTGTTSLGVTPLTTTKTGRQLQGGKTSPGKDGTNNKTRIKPKTGTSAPNYPRHKPPKVQTKLNCASLTGLIITSTQTITQAMQDNQVQRQPWNQRRTAYIAEPEPDQADQEEDDLDDYPDDYEAYYGEPYDAPGDLDQAEDFYDEDPVAQNFICLNCEANFESGNALHKHLENYKPPSAGATAEVAPAFFANGTLPLYESDRTKMHGPGYAFRTWRYATATVALETRDQCITACLDTGCVMTLIDAEIARKLGPPINKLKNPILVNGIGSQHIPEECIHLDVYFMGRKATAKLTIEAHLVAELKAKLLIGIQSKPDRMEAKPVYAKEKIVIPPHSMANIPINVETNLPNGRDFIFHPDEGNATMHTHVVDVSFSFVPVANHTPVTQTIPRRIYIGTVTETEYTTAYAVHSNAAILAANPSPAIGTVNLRPENPTEVVLDNGLTIYGNKATTAKLTDVLLQYNIWTKPEVVDVLVDRWMRIPMLDGWEKHWATEHTPTGYPVFVAYREVTKNGQQVKAGRPVIDLRDANAEAIMDMYPVPTQDDILQLCRGKRFITVLDVAAWFYQWRVHPEDTGKLGVITHRGHEIFKVAMMGHCNSVAYVQRELDHILRELRSFCRAYIDDIVLASDSLEEHISHLRKLLQILQKHNIRLEPKKTFVGFPTVTLLGQRVDSLGMTTMEEKLHAVLSLDFPKTLKELETYLSLAGYFRSKIWRHAQIIKAIHDRKTALLKLGPVKGPQRKTFSKRTPLEYPTEAEKASFPILQTAMREALVHITVFFDYTRQLYAEIDSSKDKGHSAMIFHIKKDWERKDHKKPPPANAVEPIIFLSRLLSPAEQNYWPTELEVACLVWVLQKIRHLLLAVPTDKPAIVYTDHSATVNIAVNTNLRSAATENQNLRLVRAAQFIQTFNLKVFHRSGATNKVADTLSRLRSTNPTKPSERDNLDEFTQGIDAFPAEPSEDQSQSQADGPPNQSMVFTKLSDEIKQNITQGYEADSWLSKVIATLREEQSSNDPVATALPYRLDDNGLLYLTHNNNSEALYLPKSMTGEIFNLIHDSRAHQGYDRCWQRMKGICFYKGVKLLKQYIKKCPICLENRTPRHRPYGLLQPIQNPSIPYHTISLDFIVGLPVTEEGFDALLAMTDKFSKQNGFIPGKTTWEGGDWAESVVTFFWIAGWGFPIVMISDRDPKFTQGLWRGIFLLLRDEPNTGYRPTTLVCVGASKPTPNRNRGCQRRTPNFTLEQSPALPTGHAELVSQRLNRILATPTHVRRGTTRANGYDAASYGYETRLLNPFGRRTQLGLRSHTMKNYYDKSYTRKWFASGDYVYLRLGHGYNIQANQGLPTKLAQKFAGKFKVLERIGRLAYKLELPESWNIHPTQCRAPRARPTRDRTKAIESIQARRTRNAGRPRHDGTRAQRTEYLVRFQGRGTLDDRWISTTKPSYRESFDAFDQRQSQEQH
ncbi:hypothetical protein N7449_005267 [Penicillium cf. viridicatum]|uniref:RNA-directed DNA polymerase n=1 Tax=Penicillium cf. viridicatum TaxID=2972119 RepID=A0A9W9MKY0_9EURO|nr:hypothetical protein N7449_005267 [Penicillium cf. viridicatum]